MRTSSQKNMASDGLLDTNVLVHFLLRDDRTEECRAFLRLVQSGERRVRLEVYVVHELTFVLSRVIKQMTRSDIVEFILQIISWPGIDCDRDLLAGTIDRWRLPGISFVDALLATQARMSGDRVFTVNAKDFKDVGVEVPEPLWNYTPSTSKS